MNRLSPPWLAVPAPVACSMTMTFTVSPVRSKELLVLLRDPKGRMVIFIPPLLQLLVFGYAATFDLNLIPTWAADAFYGLLKSYALWPQLLGGQPAPDPALRARITDTAVTSGSVDVDALENAIIHATTQSQAESSGGSAFSGEGDSLAVNGVIATNALISEATAYIEDAAKAAGSHESDGALRPTSEPPADQDAREQAPVSTFTSTLLGGFR